MADTTVEPISSEARLASGGFAFPSERMLGDTHDTLAALMYGYGGMDRRDVAVQFALPTPRVIEAITGPVILFSLIDLWENLDLRNSGFAMRPAERNKEDGAEFRSTPRYFDFKYLVSVHAADPEDEHAILSRLLWTLYRHQEFPRELLPAGFHRLGWRISGRLVGPGEGSRPLEVWSDLGADPRPALLYIATAPLDIERATPSPLVLSRVLRVSPLPDRTQAGDDEDSEMPDMKPEPSFERMAESDEPEELDIDGQDSSEDLIAKINKRKEDEKKLRNVRNEIMAGGLVSYGGYLVNRDRERLKGYRVLLIGVPKADAITDDRGRFKFHMLRAGR